MVHDIQERVSERFPLLVVVVRPGATASDSRKKFERVLRRFCEMCQVQRRCRVPGKTLFAAAAMPVSPSVSRTSGADANDSLNFANTQLNDLASSRFTRLTARRIVPPSSFLLVKHPSLMSYLFVVSGAATFTTEITRLWAWLYLARLKSKKPILDYVLVLVLLEAGLGLSVVHTQIIVYFYFVPTTTLLLSCERCATAAIPPRHTFAHAGFHLERVSPSVRGLYPSDRARIRADRQGSS